MKTILRQAFAAFVLASFNLSAATLYVSLESTNPMPPFATWTTAATNIQDAVDAARAGETGEPHRQTEIQRSGDLKDWQAFWLGPLDANGTRQVTHGPKGPKVFYRAVAP